MEENNKIQLMKRILGNAIADCSLNTQLPYFIANVKLFDECEEFDFSSYKTHEKNGNDVRHQFIEPFRLSDVEIIMAEGGYITCIKGARTKVQARSKPLMPIREMSFEYDEEVLFVNDDRVREGVFVITGKQVGVHKLKVFVHNIEKEVEVYVVEPRIFGTEIMDVNEKLYADVNAEWRKHELPGSSK